MKATPEDVANGNTGHPNGAENPLSNDGVAKHQVVLRLVA